MEPEAVRNIMASELAMAREKGYMNTSFHGDNAVFLFLGAWERGIEFDYAAAYEYLRKNATDPQGPRGYLAEYMKQGWISDIVPDHNSSRSAARRGGTERVSTCRSRGEPDH